MEEVDQRGHAILEDGALAGRKAHQEGAALVARRLELLGVGALLKPTREKSFDGWSGE